MKNKCIDCKERVIGCHSFCLDYIEYRNKLDEINKKIREEKEKSSQGWSYTRNRKRYR